MKKNKGIIAIEKAYDPKGSRAPKGKRDLFFFAKARELWRQGVTLTDALVKVPEAWEARKAAKRRKATAPVNPPSSLSYETRVALAKNSRHQLSAARHAARNADALDGILTEFNITNGL